MALEERLKRRLVGGAVLVALVVIFVPMLVDEPIDSRVVADHRIPDKPALIERPTPQILPAELPAVSEQDKISPEPPPQPHPEEKQ